MMSKRKAGKIFPLRFSPSACFWEFEDDSQDNLQHSSVQYNV